MAPSLNAPVARQSYKTGKKGTIFASSRKVRPAGTKDIKEQEQEQEQESESELERHCLD
jgi:hypothetical protein